MRTFGVQYLSVPYSEHQEVKALGARWNAKRGQWFVPIGVDRERFDRWITSSPVVDQIEKPAKRHLRGIA